MTFIEFKNRIIEQFKTMTAMGDLFKVTLLNAVDDNGNDKSGEMLWELYINSFKKEDDPVFRDPSSSTHNCNNDRNFVKKYGNIVALKDNKIVSLWDLDLTKDNPYYNSCLTMSKALTEGSISSLFVETWNWLNVSNYEKTNKNQNIFQIGNSISLKRYTPEEAEKYGRVEAGKVYEFNHLHAFLPKKYVDFLDNSIERINGENNATRQLFEKTISIPVETLELVRDLIQQGSLLRGDMYLSKVLEVIKLKKQYDKLNENEKSNWLWLNFKTIPYARFANELIGTTCIELAEGKDINKVCKDFNMRIDPANYNKAKSPVTPQMIALAEKTIMELGYDNSFERKFATIDDIDVSEIKHSNINNTVEKPVGLFGKAGIPTTNQFNRHKRAEFDKVESVDINKFMSDILPNATSIEVFLENRMEGNLVSLFTTKDKTAKNLFKWGNPFSWTYNGNLSGKSMIKENVKVAGGNVEGILRASMIWNESGSDNSDLDLWCKQPNGELIGYSTPYRKDRSNLFSGSGGQLDLDNTNPGNKVGVENIYFKSLNQMRNGVYEFWVNQYSSRNSQGFKFEIEADGEIYNYEYNNRLTSNEKVHVATVILTNGVFTINHRLPHTQSNKTIWNLETNQFHKVNLVCTSPNHWGDNNIGTKEYFFMLQDCKSDEPMRAFHVDQLNSELMNNRKAIDLLGNYKLVEPSNNQLSGVGFNSTVRDEIIVKVKGSHQRLLKIQF
jgi:hypothetical protein